MWCAADKLYSSTQKNRLATPERKSNQPRPYPMPDLLNDTNEASAGRKKRLNAKSPACTGKLFLQWFGPMRAVRTVHCW